MMGPDAPIQDSHEKRLDKLNKAMNVLINELYDEIAMKVFSLDDFIIPAHGIQRPDSENPTNLFKRQLKLEELSFELAH